MRYANVVLIGVVFSLGLSGCALFEDSDFYPERFSEHVEAKRSAAFALSSRGIQQGKLSINSSSLAAQALIHKANGTIRKDSPLIVASFADSESVTSTTGFGRMLSQQFSTQLVNNGYKVAELLMRDNIYITENGGEFLLSRKAKDSSQQYEAHAAVVGTYVVGYDTIFVNAKVVDISTNTILAAHNFNVALDENVKKMLEKSPYIHSATN